MEVEYCKIIFWFTSYITCVFIYKHILRCTYKISQKNWIDTFYNLFFTDERTKLNHKAVQLWYSTYVYTNYFYSLISIFIIELFDVRVKLNNHNPQYSYLKFTYDIKSLQMDCHTLQSSNALFSKCDRFFNHIFIEITLYDTSMKYNNHILQWCILNMYAQNKDIM